MWVLQRLSRLANDFICRTVSLSLLFCGRLIYGRSHYASYGFSELAVLLFGYRPLFGRGLDLRGSWESIRLDSRRYMPHLPSHLNGLEIAVNLLMPKSGSCLNSTFYCYLMLLVLLLNDESSHRGNHRIGCLLGKSLLCERAGCLRLARRYRLMAYKEYRCHSAGAFYNEGSTHYHVFTTCLFALFLPRGDFRRLFKRAQLLSVKLLFNDALRFGDSDPFDPTQACYGLQDLFNVREFDQFNPCQERVVDKFSAKFFFQFSLGRYDFLVKKFNEGCWGHENDECGDIRLLVDNKCISYSPVITTYTTNLSHRRYVKYRKKNGVIDLTKSIDRYFEPVDKDECEVVSAPNTATISYQRGKFIFETEDNNLFLMAELTDSTASAQIHIWQSDKPCLIKIEAGKMTRLI